MSEPGFEPGFSHSQRDALSIGPLEQLIISTIFFIVFEGFL